MDAFLGSTSGRTRQRLRARSLVRVSRDVYVPRDRADDLAVRLRGLQLAVPDAVASHATAAELLRLPTPRDSRLHLTRPAGSATVRRVGVVAHVRDLPEGDVSEVAGVRVTSPERLLVDLAPVLSLLDLVVLGDAAARRCGLPRLLARTAQAQGRRGAVRLRQALALVEPGSGSPAETRVRLLLHRAGFTGLRHGVVVRDPLGQWLAEPDLADEQARVAVQYDGLVHLEAGPRRWQADVDRDELTRLAGWELVVLTGRDLRFPEAACAKVAGAYARSTRRR